MAKKIVKKNGRPTIYTLKLAKQVCKALAISTHGLRKVCQNNPNFPCADTILMWRLENKEFSALYDNAKQHQIEALADDMLDIADDAINDYRQDKDGNDVIDSEHIQRSRVRIDTRKWLCAKLMPKKYGDRTITESTVKVTHEEALKELE